VKITKTVTGFRAITILRAMHIDDIVQEKAAAACLRHNAD